MIYDKTYLKLIVSKYLPIHKSLGHSKLADVIHTAGDLSSLSHRQLRKYIGEVREESSLKGTGNKLVIGDIHEPFSLDDYLPWCQEMYIKHECDSVLFAGDVLDNHFSSYHESDPDGLSAGDELFWAKQRLNRWYKAFPGTNDNPINILMGNHDLLIKRKAKTAGLSTHVLKSFGDIIDAPSTWKFHYDDIVIDNVLYSHGNVGDAAKKAVINRISTVQGHLHSLGYVQHFVSIKDAIFAVQCMSGIDRHKYAFAYGKPFAKKPIIGCAIIKDFGKNPLIEVMPL